MCNDIGTTMIANYQHSHLTDYMKNYQEYLKLRYRSLELTPPDEMLDCSSSQYIDLILIKDNKRKPIRQKTNRKIRGNEMEHVTLSEALDVENQEKKVVLIEGGPGMGKTTLAINICKCWAEGNLLQSYDAVVLLTLRDPEIQQSKTIADLLLTVDDKMRENVFEEIIKNHGEKICFIFEGYDELPSHISRSPVFSKVVEKLPKCMLIYTSRPGYCFPNHASQIKINGFTEESISEYITNTFENELQMAFNLKSQLDKSPEIKKILHFPINVAIVCLVFFHFSKLPGTLTELYTLLCLRLLLRHIIKRTPNVKQVKILDSLNNLPEDISEEFSKLCYIAYEGLYNKRQRIIFSSEDLYDMGVVEDSISGLGLLLIAPSMSVYGVKKSYNFLHKTLQEFCAAWYISKLSTEEQIKCFNSYFTSCFDISKKFNHMVWRFYSGITKLMDKKITNFVLPYSSVISPFTQAKLLMFISLIYEAQNSSLCQTIGELLNGCIELELDYWFLESDYCIDALGYFLMQYKGELEYINCANISDKIFCIIVKSLKKRVSFKDNGIVFNVSLENITANSFSAFTNLLTVHKYPVVKLCMQLYTMKHMQLLSKIMNSNETLKVLDLAGLHSAKEEDVLYLLNHANFKLLQKLILVYCKIGSTGAGQVGEILSGNKSIISVNLRLNEIDDTGVERLVYHLKNNNTLKSLDLRSNQITAIGVTYLKETIANKLDCIYLSGNRLGHIGIYLALEAVTIPMKHIGLCGRDASFSCRSFAVALHKVKSVNLTIPDDYDDCAVLCKSLANATMLTSLEITSLCTNDINYQMVLNAIEQNDNITSLDISYWTLSERCAVDLAQFIKQNKSLKNLNVTFSDEVLQQGLMVIADSLSTNNSISCVSCNSSTVLFIVIEMSSILKFLNKLKCADSLNTLILSMNIESHGSRFYHPPRNSFQEVERSVQEINSIRSMKDVSPLLVVIRSTLFISNDIELGF